MFLIPPIILCRYDEEHYFIPDDSGTDMILGNGSA
jgi:hypothetical protein